MNIHLDFTFQSGYIQIIRFYVLTGARGCFTFQSGYIQILATKTNKIPFIIFTFQSGYIQISSDSANWYGSIILYIPIWLYSNSVQQSLQVYFCQLYIPIWLYSNRFYQLCHLPIRIFTFQSGYIQMAKGICPCQPLRALHSNLVIFKSTPALLLNLLPLLYIPIWLYSN